LPSIVMRHGPQKREDSDMAVVRRGYLPPICMNVKTQDLQNLHFRID